MAYAIAGISSIGSLTGICTAFAHSGVAVAAVHVVGADHVGEEERVEATPLEELGQLDPRVERVYSSWRVSYRVHSPCWMCDTQFIVNAFRRSRRRGERPEALDTRAP